MDDIDHPAFIKELKQIFDDAAYENNLYKHVNLPSIKKNICNDKTEY